MRPRRLGHALPLLALLLATPALADPYDYAERGGYWEGIRPRPVSGADIELVSVRAEPVAMPAGRVPEQLRLAFFLPQDPAGPPPVQVRVRELDYRHYYWLDRVRPGAPWRTGAANDWHWPTRTVLAWLMAQDQAPLTPAELGVLVRLDDRPGPVGEERVAPAVLAADGALVVPTAWLFTLKANVPARAECRLYRDGSPGPVWQRTLKDIGAGRPFSCAVPAATLARGSYRLEVDGWSLETHQPVRQDVRFYHEPDLH